MAPILIYHNGECNKCNGTSAIMQQKGLDVDYKFYLHEPMTVPELQGLRDKLDVPVTDMLRKTEPLYLEEFEGKQLTDTEWLQAIVDHPVLLQRPIVVNGEKAVIARPPEKVLEIL